MNVMYHEKAQQGGEGPILLKDPTAHLEEILGAFRSSVSAEWDRTEDANGRVLYRLALSDPDGMVSADFAPHELKSPGQTRIRLRHLWGDLLQKRSDAQVKKLQELVQQLEPGQGGA